jgi:hypothetical protein
MRISLHISSPKAYFTGAIPAVKRATCSSSDSDKRFCKFLLGAYSELSESKIRRSMGKLNCLRAFSCYSLFGYPTTI